MSRRLYTCTDFPGESFTVEDVHDLTGTPDADVYRCALKGVPIAGFLFTLAGKREGAAAIPDEPTSPAGTWRQAGDAVNAKGAERVGGWVRNSDPEAMEALPVNPMRLTAAPDGEVRT